MKSDPTIDEVRHIRRIISAEYGNDPRRVLKYFAEVQTRVKNRLVNYGVPALLNPAKRSGGSADNAFSDRESLPVAR